MSLIKVQHFAQVKVLRSRHEATVPSILGVQKLTNPFLRWEEPALQGAVKSADPQCRRLPVCGVARICVRKAGDFCLPLFRQSPHGLCLVKARSLSNHEEIILSDQAGIHTAEGS